MSLEQNERRSAILLARCSTPQQTEYSVARQIEHMRLYTESHGYNVVDEIKLEGVSGLVPEARTDIDQIITRKQQKNDFEYVIVADIDRLTRGGVPHGFWIYHEFELRGIQIVSAREEIPEGPNSWIILGMKFSEANAEITTLLNRMMGGMTLSLLDGRNVHTSVIPFGLDRLYLTPEGVPLHRIRNLADGTQQMLKPEGEGPDALIRTFPKTEKLKKSPHYKRQAQEHVTFVPGDPERLKAVRHIFHRHLVDGWGGFRIAQELNDVLVVPSAKGKQWAEGTVMQVLGNTVYTGIGYANRMSAAQRARRTRTVVPMKAPKLSMIGKKGNRLKMPRREYRPPEFWIAVTYPLMLDYLINLSPTMRKTLRESQVAHYHHMVAHWSGPPKQRKHGGDPHLEGAYILKHLFYSKQDRIPLVARPSDGHRYYARSRATCYPSKLTPFRSVRAEVVEGEVLRVAHEVIKSFPDLKQSVHDLVSSHSKSLSGDSATARESLMNRRDQLLKNIHTISKAHADLGIETVQKLTTGDKEELRRIEDRLRQPVKKEIKVDVDEIASRVLRSLNDLPSAIHKDMVAFQVHNVLSMLIQRMEMDMETNVVDLELALPSWCGDVELDSAESVRLVIASYKNDVDQTHAKKTLKLGHFRGKFNRGTKAGPPALTLLPVVSTRRRTG